MRILPKISIITPTLNAEKDIIQCIESVACQTYSQIEHLIVDGGSTDSTVDLIRQLAPKYSHLTIISEKDNGIYDGMNKGIELASGEWLYFLGSDDIFYNDQVISDFFSLVDTSCFDFVYGNVLWGETGNIYDGKFSLLKIMQKNICHQAIFYRASIFNKIGKFNLNYKAWADWLFNIKCFCNDEIRRKYIDIIVAKFALGGHSSRVVEDVNFLEDKLSIIKTFFPDEYIQNEVRLQNLMSEVFQKNEQLVAKEVQLVCLKQQIDAFQNSLSWKITKPARAILDMINNLKK